MMTVAEFSFHLYKILYMVLKARVMEPDQETGQDPEKDTECLEDAADLTAAKETTETTEIIETITENEVAAVKEITEEKINIMTIVINIANLKVEAKDLPEMKWNVEAQGVIRDPTRIVIANDQGINMFQLWE